MSPDPRSQPASDPDPGNGGGPTPAPATNGAGRVSATNGQSAVLVASTAETALAAVERHLRQEAIEARLVATSSGPTTSVPAARQRPGSAPSRAPVRIVPGEELDEGSYDDHGQSDAAFWGETRPRRGRRTIDVDDLEPDERRAVGKLQARKVRRILRHVSPWSVLKFSSLFYLCVWLIVLIAGVILWRLGQEAGAISNIENFYAKATGEVEFELDGRSVFRAAASGGIILVMAGTAFTVLLSVLFNLITDLTGGVRMTVIELGDARRPVNTRRAGGRRLLRRVKAGSATAEPALAASPSSRSSDPVATSG